MKSDSPMLFSLYFQYIYCHRYYIWLAFQVGAGNSRLVLLASQVVYWTHVDELGFEVQIVRFVGAECLGTPMIT